MKLLKKISIHAGLFTILFLPFFVSAQLNTGPTTININIPNPARRAGSDLMAVLTTLITNVVMPVAAVLVVMYVIYAGFTFVTAQGNPKEIEAAKSRLLWALIGAGILLGAAGIARVVENTVRPILTIP